MKILVTGGAGFIGSHIVDLYIAHGHKVVVVDNLSTGKRNNLNPKAKFIKLDIRDLRLSKVFIAEKPDIVNHQAAQVSVAASVRDPYFDANVNIRGSVNVFECAHRVNIKKIIFASSGGVLYGEVKGEPSNENYPANPQSPYGIAKFTAEKYLEFYKREYGIPYVALRYANVYGPRQDPYGEAGVIAIFVNAMLSGKTPTINGDGKCVRDYVYCEDVANASLIALKKEVQGAFNVGTSVGTDVNKLFSLIAEQIGFKKRANHGSARPGDLKRNIISANKLKKIGWIPKFTLVKGLQKTIDYFKTS